MGLPRDTTYPRQFGFDLIEAINHLLGMDVYTHDTLWGTLPRFVWSESRRAPWCGWLIDECRKYTDDICVLTAPTRCPECAAGKVEWLNRNLPGMPYVIARQKFRLARPDAILIDDAEHNLNAWTGPSICFPQPWNYLHDLDPVSFVRVALRREFA